MIKEFVKDHKKELIIGGGALVVGVAAGKVIGRLEYEKAFLKSFSVYKSYPKGTKMFPLLYSETELMTELGCTAEDLIGKFCWLK